MQRYVLDSMMQLLYCTIHRFLHHEKERKKKKKKVGAGQGGDGWHTYCGVLYWDCRSFFFF